MTLRLYVDAALADGAEFELAPGPARHVQVRRLQPGDALTLFDGRGGEWAARVVQMGRQLVSVCVGAHIQIDREPALAVTLAVGMPANERMDALVEKATELGVHAVVPLHTERSVLRLTGERAQRKQAHWQAVAVAAAEQCGRTRVPVVAPVQGLVAWLAALDAASAPAGARWVLSPAAAATPRARPAGGTLIALSGPEGGLAEAELAAARRAGFVPQSLGPRVLRADTAPLALLAGLAWADGAA